MNGFKWPGRCLLALILAAAHAGAWELADGMVADRLDTSQSSFIERAEFFSEPDAAAGTLVIRIKGESISYFDVPVAVWHEFKAADSIGAFYGKHIKQQYERQVGEPQAARCATGAARRVQAWVASGFNEECENLVLPAVDAAQTQILVAAYAFTRTRIAAALVRARARGVDVRMKIDAKQAEYPLAEKQLAYLARHDIPVERIAVRGEYAAMHNKFMVVDRRIVIAGSYNYTTTAQFANWENVLSIESPEIAASYAEAWEAIRSDSGSESAPAAE